MKLILTPTIITAGDPDKVPPTVTIEVPFDDLACNAVVEFLVRPALLAAGYAESSVEEALHPAEVSDV